MSWPRSLAGRVTLAAIVALAIALAVAGTSVVLVTTREDRRALDRDLVSLVERPPPPPRERFHEGGRERDIGEDRFVRYVAAQGTLLEEGATVPTGFPLTDAGEVTTVEAGGHRWRTVVRTDPRGFAVQAAARLDQLDDRAGRLRRIVLGVALTTLALTAVAVRSLARLALEPLHRLGAAAGEVAETADPSRRVPGGGPEEVDALAGEMNTMLARLEEAGLQRETALQAARTFAADAGHELRTPLTSLAANLRAARDDPAALAAGERDAARLGALVEQLQALARGEAGAPARPEPVDLGELGDSAVAALRTRHPEVAVTLEAPGEGPVLQGDAEGLRIMVDNLLENAARHGAGAVRLTVREGELLVDDDGPGIPAAEREAVQRRFVRGSTAQGNGTGLGLAIAGAQAERHGGALALGDSPLGGLRARVTLPS